MSLRDTCATNQSGSTQITGLCIYKALFHNLYFMSDSFLWLTHKDNQKLTI